MRRGRPTDGVRGADLATDDPLRGEWTVTVVGPHDASALIARDLGDGGPDVERRFEFVTTHDGELVLRAARSLMARLVPAIGSDGSALAAADDRSHATTSTSATSRSTAASPGEPDHQACWTRPREQRGIGAAPQASRYLGG